MAKVLEIVRIKCDGCGKQFEDDPWGLLVTKKHMKEGTPYKCDDSNVLMKPIMAFADQDYCEDCIRKIIEMGRDCLMFSNQKEVPNSLAWKHRIYMNACCDIQRKGNVWKVPVAPVGSVKDENDINKNVDRNKFINLYINGYTYDELRAEFGLMNTAQVRQCLVLAEKEGILKRKDS